MALLAASALLAGLGIMLLTHEPPSAPRPASEPAAAPTHSRIGQPSSASTLPATAPTTHGSTSPSSTAVEDAQPSAIPMPEDVAGAARQFVLAWAGHDARPGKDGSYNDAAHRARAYAGKDLAVQLTTDSASSTRRWQQWTQANTVVTAEITQIAVPDGAPEPTADTAWARVRYRLIVAPAAGQPSSTDEQVALKLQRDQAGAWLVTALPEA